MKKNYILFIALIILVVLNLILSRTGGELVVVKGILIIGILAIAGIFVFSNFIENKKEKKAKKCDKK